jgi:hypothetical protein
LVKGSFSKPKDGRNKGGYLGDRRGYTAQHNFDEEEYGDRRRKDRVNTDGLWRKTYGGDSSKNTATSARGGPGNRSCNSSGSSNYLGKGDLALRREREENLTGGDSQGVIGGKKINSTILYLAVTVPARRR